MPWGVPRLMRCANAAASARACMCWCVHHPHRPSASAQPRPTWNSSPSRDQSPPSCTFSLPISACSFPMCFGSCAVTARSPATLVPTCALPELATADRNCRVQPEGRMSTRKPWSRSATWLGHWGAGKGRDRRGHAGTGGRRGQQPHLKIHHQLHELHVRVHD